MPKNLKSEQAFKRLSEHLEEKLANKPHAYEHEKTPPVPHQIPVATPKLKVPKNRLEDATISSHKPLAKALEQMHCNANQNYPLFFIEKAEGLSARNIKNHKFKERLIAIRNIKRISHEMQQWISAKVRHEVKNLKKEETKEIDYLFDKREERHFQIDRIIRYLADP